MSKLTVAKGNWREQVVQLRRRLQKVRADLIDAEANLTERLAAIRAFEFQLRTVTEQLVRQLEEVDAEIKAITQKRYGKVEVDDEAESHTYWGEEGAAASGEYRYMGEMKNKEAADLSRDDAATLKRLYRQLARRFHPDMGVDEADQAYRTQMMMAINAAYAVGDLKKLQALALEPDAASAAQQADSDQQLAEVLLRELARHQQRLAELAEELLGLNNHKSAHLMKRAERAQAQGRDFFADVVDELRDKLAIRRMELDLLQNDEWEKENETLSDSEFDEGVHALDEWMSGKERPFTPPKEYYKDILDDNE